MSKLGLKICLLLSGVLNIVFLTLLIMDNPILMHNISITIDEFLEYPSVWSNLLILFVFGCIMLLFVRGVLFFFNCSFVRLFNEAFKNSLAEKKREEFEKKEKLIKQLRYQYEKVMKERDTLKRTVAGIKAKVA